MQYAKITGRIALMVADSTDADENPDEVYATAGQVVFTPNVKRVQGAGLFRLPQPITCDIDAQGYLSLNANREVFLLDLGDPTISPNVPRNQGAWKVEFKGLKFGTTSLAIDFFYINPDAADNDVASGQVDAGGLPVQKNDLSVLAPIPTGSAGAGITRGPAGPAGEGVPDTTGAADGDVITYTTGGGIIWAAPTGGGGTALTSYDTQVKTLADYPTTFPPAPHQHVIADVASLQADLDAKVPTSRLVNGKPLSADISLVAADITGAYAKPGTGIPKTDLASAVQTSLSSADTAVQPATLSGYATTAAVAAKYTKPGTGIPETDLDTTTQGKIDGAAPATLTVAGLAISTNITATQLLSALGIPLASLAIIVQWDATNKVWPAYSNDPTRVRQFYSQNDATATAPTYYSQQDDWFKA